MISTNSNDNGFLSTVKGIGSIASGAGAVLDAGASIYGAYQQNKINEQVLKHNIEMENAQLKLAREKFGIEQQAFRAQAPGIRAQSQISKLQADKLKDFLSRQEKIRKGGF